VPSPASSGFTEDSVIEVEDIGKGEERETVPDEAEEEEEEAAVEEKGKEEKDGTIGTPSTACICVCICICDGVSVCVRAISLTLVSYAALTDFSIISRRRPSMLKRCRALLALPPC
jgi:hypothetical protein